MDALLDAYGSDEDQESNPTNNGSESSATALQSLPSNPPPNSIHPIRDTSNIRETAITIPNTEKIEDRSESEDPFLTLYNQEKLSWEGGNTTDSNSFAFSFEDVDETSNKNSN